MARIPYNQAELDFLTENTKLMRSELTILFNQKFNRTLTKDQIKSKCTRMGLKTGRKGGTPKGYKKPGDYTDEQLDFLKENRKLKRKHLTTNFNNHFNENKTIIAIKQCCKKHGFYTGRDGKFQKGSIPFNKGMKGWQAGGNSVKTQFKKGHTPVNARPVGYERINGDGYTEVVIKKTNPHTGYERTFVLKHREMWEQKHGPIPDNHLIIFKDGNIKNVCMDNFEMISLREHSILNHAGHKHAPAQLKPTLRAIAKLKAATNILQEQQ